MRSVTVRYKVKAGLGDENERLIRAVFEELARDAPAGLRYQSYRLPDGVSFLHVASIDTPDGSNPLLAVEAFKRFTADIAARCDEPPATTQVAEMGSYVG
jgi:hypothetical protein